MNTNQAQQQQSLLTKKTRRVHETDEFETYAGKKGRALLTSIL